MFDSRKRIGRKSLWGQDRGGQLFERGHSCRKRGGRILNSLRTSVAAYVCIIYIGKGREESWKMGKILGRKMRDLEVWERPVKVDQTRSGQSGRWCWKKAEQQFRRYLAAKLGVIEQNLRHILAKTFLLVGFRLKSVLRYWSELAILREDSLQWKWPNSFICFNRAGPVLAKQVGV